MLPPSLKAREECFPRAVSAAGASAPSLSSISLAFESFVNEEERDVEGAASATVRRDDADEGPSAVEDEVEETNVDEGGEGLDEEAAGMCNKGREGSFVAEEGIGLRIRGLLWMSPTRAIFGYGKKW